MANGLRVVEALRRLDFAALWGVAFLHSPVRSEHLSRVDVFAVLCAGPALHRPALGHSHGRKHHLDHVDCSWTVFSELHSCKIKKRECVNGRRRATRSG